MFAHLKVIVRTRSQSSIVVLALNDGSTMLVINYVINARWDEFILNERHHRCELGHQENRRNIHRLLPNKYKQIENK